MSCTSLSLHIASHGNPPTTVEDDICSQCLNSLESHTSEKQGPKLICHFCDQVFQKRNVLLGHLKIEHGRIIYNDLKLKIYACSLGCNSLYQRAQDITKHMNIQHGVALVKPEDFIVKSLKDVSYPCVVCDTLCVLSRQCDEHAQYAHLTVENTDDGQSCNHNAADHQCHKCSIEFGNCSELWSHMFGVHQDCDLECNLCETRVKFMNVFVHHMKHTHNIILKLDPHLLAEFREKTIYKDDSGRKFKCPECPKTMVNYKGLNRHLFLHSDFSLVCKVCEKVFSTPMNLERHVRLHKRKDPPLNDYLCNICGRGFSIRGNYETHMRMHRNERNYVCELCGKAFVQWASLFYHKFSHGEKKLVCSYCGKLFKNPNHLRAHINIHTKKIKYNCKTCGKEFLSRNALVSHQIVHSTARPFVCEQCNAAFKIKKHLVTHYKTHGRITIIKLDGAEVNV